MKSNEFFIPSDLKEIKKERDKARIIKKSHWWYLKLQTGQCYFCHKSFLKEELTMEHLVPLVRGGKSVKSNLEVSCKECNSKKKYNTSVEMVLKG